MTHKHACMHQIICRFFHPSKFDASSCTRASCKYAEQRSKETIILSKEQLEEETG